jgi:hypothetical protein
LFLVFFLSFFLLLLLLLLLPLRISLCDMLPFRINSEIKNYTDSR